MSRPVAVLATACLALLASACGGSSVNHVATVGSGGSAPVSTAIAFAHCMRSNGVRNWPDPDSSGVFDKSKLTTQQLGTSDSQLAAAQRSCRRLLPNGGTGPSTAQVQQIRAQALRYSQCVRAHGVAGFPDPGSDGRIPDPASAGINQGSPRFEAANQACGRSRPPYMPSNGAYNSWARTHPS